MSVPAVTARTRSSRGTPRTAVMAATVNSAGVGTPPRSILRIVSSASPRVAPPAPAPGSRPAPAAAPPRAPARAPAPARSTPPEPQRDPTPHDNYPGIVVPWWAWTSPCRPARPPSSTACARPAGWSPRTCCPRRRRSRCPAARPGRARPHLHRRRRRHAVLPRLPPDLGPARVRRGALPVSERDRRARPAQRSPAQGRRPALGRLRRDRRRLARRRRRHRPHRTADRRRRAAPRRDRGGAGGRDRRRVLAA